MVSTILLRHFISTSGHFTAGNVTAGNSYSNTNTTGSARSAKLQHQKSDDKKEDLNVLFKRDEVNAIKFKKECDYGTYRRGSKEKDDVHFRRSRESDFHHRRDTEIYPSIYSSSRDKNREADTEPWLEVGCVSLGPIIVESASALPIPEHCLHLVQHKYTDVDGFIDRFHKLQNFSYLKTHDKRAKRLWFLWTMSSDGARCGCTGGCAFFGSNNNGPKFFKPSAQDVQDGINIARYQYVL